MYYTVFIILVIGSFVQGELTCPELQNFENFQTEKINGIWYCCKQYHFNMTSNLKCMKYECTSDDTGYMLLDIDAVDKRDNSPVYISATLFPEGDPKNTVFTDVVRHDRHTYKMHMMNMIGTDYDNYIIFFTCDEKKMEAHSWIMVRSRDVSESVEGEINKVLEKNNIDVSLYEEVEQKDCNN